MHGACPTSQHAQCNTPAVWVAGTPPIVCTSTTTRCTMQQPQNCSCCGGSNCWGNQNYRQHLQPPSVLLLVLLLSLLLQPIPQLKHIILAILGISLIQQATPLIHHIKPQRPTSVVSGGKTECSKNQLLLGRLRLQTASIAATIAAAVAFSAAPASPTDETSHTGNP